ncbi:MAG TPA: hypothetical protein DD435_01650 [Cyanobacteria bacterium UBA8530]|nr:hypothetical protein [Cyanobacteria bacterium UBA8530]
MQKRQPHRNIAWDRTIWTKLLGRPNAPDEKIPSFSTDESLVVSMVSAARSKKIAIDVVQEPANSGKYFILSPETRHGPLKKNEVPASLAGILAAVLDILASPEFAEKDDD